MSRTKKIIAIVAGSIVGLILLVVIAAIIVVQTPWFQNWVREKIIATTEESTGGRVDLAAFHFDLWHLRATLDGFVLHGKEPPNVPPLFQAKRLQVDMALFSAGQTFDLRSIVVDTPSADVIVNPDGTTNIPEPKVKSQSKKSGLETVVDLAIGHFDLRNGSLQFADRKLPLDARGDNLRALLQFDYATQRYTGQISMAPLLVTYANNQPIDLNVTVPVTLEKDRIGFDNAKIATPASEITLTGAVSHMVSPEISGHANARFSVAEVERATGMKISPEAQKTLPAVATADLAFSMTNDRIEVSSAHLTFGRSTVEASGLLENPSGNPPGLDFRAHFDIGQLAPLANVSGRPEGVVNINGKAKLAGGSAYQVAGNIQAENVAITQGTERLSNINLTSAFSADQHLIALNDLRLRALGGELDANAGIYDMSRFQVDGRLRDFDLNTLSRVATGKPLGYAGTLTGPIKADGNLKSPGVTGIQASANLSIVPGRDGVPVSGRLNAVFNGAHDTVEIGKSYIALPHSRLELSGNLGQRINVQFRSTDLNDFLPAMRATSKTPVDTMPVALNGGTATFSGAVTGKLTAPQLQGHLAVNNFSVEGRRFDQLAADVSASPSGAQLENTHLTRDGMQIQVAANIGLHNWKALPGQPLNLNVTIRNGDVADLLALAGQPKVPVTGTLNADVHLGGTVANPLGSADATVTNGVAYDQPFSQAQAQVGFSKQQVTLSSATVTTPAGGAQLSGTFTHPSDSYSRGQIQAQFNTAQLQLGKLQAVDQKVHGLSGTLHANANLSANLNEVKGQAEFTVDTVNADLNLRGLQAEGQNYGDLTATARTNAGNVDYRANSDLAGSTIRVNGQTELRPDYPTTADASIQALKIESLLALAGRKDIPARGTLSGTAQVSGTMKNPSASVDMALTKAVLYDQPLDRVALRASYTDRLVDVPHLEIVDGPSHIEGSASYAHAPGDFEDGQAKFQLTSNALPLGRFHTLQKYRPGLAGTLQLAADGAATVRKQTSGSPEVLVSSLSANVDATGLAINQEKLGNLRLGAKTTGDQLAFNLNSDLAGARITASGDTTLRQDYPTKAQLEFTNLTYAGLQPLLGRGGVAKPMFTASVEGHATLNGPLMNTDALTARLTLTRVEVASTSPPPNQPPVAIRNQGSIVIALDHSLVRIDSARLTGPQTLITAAGTASLKPGQRMDLSLKANTNLNLLQQMSRDIFSSGEILLDATVRGTMNKPLINGRLDLQKVSFNYIDLPNGISNANGVILFNGNNASIQSLSGESGGGKIAASGFVSYTGPVLAYGLKATARRVQVRYPPGASVIASANVNLSGTSERSLLGGTVTIDQIGFSTQSDFGSMLSSTATPPQAPTAPTGPLAGMRFDISIRTSPDVQFQTALAQNLQATANLTLRGTVDQPGMLGRVNVTEGDLVFFGNKYTVNQGNINFYDPNRIRPVLNIELETVAKGVTVDLDVEGPIDDMKLTYRSDPPLQFNEVVALLATGKMPTDPNIVAQQPAEPPETFQQMGESALVSQAIANPISNRLKRVFGVSELKIDPTFTSGSDLPQARVTLQQQITSNLVFTYVTNVTQTNDEIIRIEWAINPKWSAILQRDETGQVAIDLFYKTSRR